MLADDEVLLDELDIDTQRVLEAAERPALAGIDLNATQVPTGISAEPSQVLQTSVRQKLALCTYYSSYPYPTDNQILGSP